MRSALHVGLFPSFSAPNDFFPKNHGGCIALGIVAFVSSLLRALYFSPLLDKACVDFRLTRFFMMCPSWREMRGLLSSFSVLIIFLHCLMFYFS